MENCLKFNRPQNYQELFNLRHAQARNVIERIFSVSKRQFPILGQACEYDLPTQIRIWVAFAAIFTFNQMHNEDSVYNNPMAELPADEQQIVFGGEEEGVNDERGEMLLGGQIGDEEHLRAEQRRDRIAMAMWESYQAELARREQVN